MPAKKKAAKKKVRCAAKTKDGKRCKRTASPPAKYCYLHKGWKPSKKKTTKKKTTKKKKRR